MKFARYARHAGLGMAISFLVVGCGQQADQASQSFSLTGPDYSGKKYYLGWGAAAYRDPSNMQNEVKYDVLHTHDIFTEEVGGSYIGTKEIGPQVNATTIKGHWSSLKEQMTADDMYVQYSSGHGYPSGLGVGVSYEEMKNYALSLPAKEVVIFTMACHSGGLVNAFNRDKAKWEGYSAEGRSLLVLASSTIQQTSSTGPGRDPDEPNSPYGSAGSAFGHALWKALIGYADGYVDGVKDGYISIDEIVEFTKYKTRRIGGHSPQSTGSYNGNVIMNRVPSKEFISKFTHTTEGLSDDEIMQQVRDLDQALRVN